MSADHNSSSKYSTGKKQSNHSHYQLQQQHHRHHHKQQQQQQQQQQHHPQKLKRSKDPDRDYGLNKSQHNQLQPNGQGQGQGHGQANELNLTLDAFIPHSHHNLPLLSQSVKKPFLKKRSGLFRFYKCLPTIVHTSSPTSHHPHSPNANNEYTNQTQSSIGSSHLYPIKNFTSATNNVNQQQQHGHGGWGTSTSNPTSNQIHAHLPSSPSHPPYIHGHGHNSPPNNNNPYQHQHQHQLHNKCLGQGLHNLGHSACANNSIEIPGIKIPNGTDKYRDDAPITSKFSSRIDDTALEQGDAHPRDRDRDRDRGRNETETETEQSSASTVTILDKRDATIRNPEVPRSKSKRSWAPPHQVSHRSKNGNGGESETETDIVNSPDMCFSNSHHEFIGEVKVNQPLELEDLLVEDLYSNSKSAYFSRGRGRGHHATTHNPNHTHNGDKEIEFSETEIKSDFSKSLENIRMELDKMCLSIGGGGGGGGGSSQGGGASGKNCYKNQTGVFSEMDMLQNQLRSIKTKINQLDKSRLDLNVDNMNPMPIMGKNNQKHEQGEESCKEEGGAKIKFQAEPEPLQDSRHDYDWGCEFETIKYPKSKGKSQNSNKSAGLSNQSDDGDNNNSNSKIKQEAIFQIPEMGRGMAMTGLPGGESRRGRGVNPEMQSTIENIETGLGTMSVELEHLQSSFVQKIEMVEEEVHIKSQRWCENQIKMADKVHTLFSELDLLKGQVKCQQHQVQNLAENVDKEFQAFRSEYQSKQEKLEERIRVLEEYRQSIQQQQQSQSFHATTMTGPQGQGQGQGQRSLDPDSKNVNNDSRDKTTTTTTTTPCPSVGSTETLFTSDVGKRSMTTSTPLPKGRPVNQASQVSPRKGSARAKSARTETCQVQSENNDSDENESKRGATVAADAGNSDEEEHGGSANKQIVSARKTLLNGDIETVYTNGTREVVKADKSQVKHLYRNGDVRTLTSDGAVTYFYAESSTWQTTYPNGVELFKFPNGLMERRLPHGLIEQTDIEGRVTFFQSHQLNNMPSNNHHHMEIQTIQSPLPPHLPPLALSMSLPNPGASAPHSIPQPHPLIHQTYNSHTSHSHPQNQHQHQQQQRSQSPLLELETQPKGQGRFHPHHPCRQLVQSQAQDSVDNHALLGRPGHHPHQLMPLPMPISLPVQQQRLNTMPGYHPQQSIPTPVPIRSSKSRGNDGQGQGQGQGEGDLGMGHGSDTVKLGPGERIVVFENGEEEIHGPDYRKRIFGDGTVKTVYNDGSQETRYPNGRIRIKDGDGNLVADVTLPNKPQSNGNSCNNNNNNNNIQNSNRSKFPQGQGHHPSLNFPDPPAPPTAQQTQQHGLSISDALDLDLEQAQVRSHSQQSQN